MPIERFPADDMCVASRFPNGWTFQLAGIPTRCPVRYGTGPWHCNHRRSPPASEIFIQYHQGSKGGKRGGGRARRGHTEVRASERKERGRNTRASTPVSRRSSGDKTTIAIAGVRRISALGRRKHREAHFRWKWNVVDGKEGERITPNCTWLDTIRGTNF